MFKRVLFATDFSEHAQQAARWAAQLAKSNNGTVVLVHALEDDLVATAPIFAGYMHTEVLDLGRYREEFRSAAQAALEAAAKPIRDAGVPVELHLVEGGKPWQSLVKAAENLRASVIVLATHGRAGLAHALIGSTAERVVRTAHCPVLTVHRGDAFDD